MTDLEHLIYKKTQFFVNIIININNAYLVFDVKCRHWLKNKTKFVKLAFKSMF